MSCRPLSALASVLALVSFAGLARGAELTLLNGDALIEPLSSVDQAYPALLSERTAVIVVGHYRGLATPAEARLFAVDTTAATTGMGPLMTAAGRDVVGVSAVSSPAPHFVGVHRSVGAPSNVFVTSFPVMGLPANIGFAALDLPELDCSPSGSCSLSYARVDAPAALVIRRFALSGGPGAVTVSGGTVVSITDPPRPGQHDVAMLGAQPVVVSAHPNPMAVGRSQIRIALVPAALTSGMYVDRAFVLDGERPRVACGPVDCAVLYVNGPDLFAARVSGGPVGELSAPAPLTAHAAAEVPGAFDVTAIDGGFRVAYVRTLAGRNALVVSDYVRGLSMAAADSTTLSRFNAPHSVRLASAPSSRLSLLTWVEGAAMTATAHGAIIREPRDAGPEPSGPEAGVDAASDAIVDAIADAEASAPVVEPTIEAGVDATVADVATPFDAAVPLDAALDARSAPDSSIRRTDRAFSGGACDCRASPARSAPRASDVLWLALALALAARRRLSARS